MKVSKVQFDGQVFLLHPDQSVVETKAAIVEAARNGADFVDFITVGHGTISLLITPNLPMRFQELERTEDELREIADDPPPIDRAFDELDYELL